MEEEEDETLRRILSELEDLQHSAQTSTALSESALSDLRSLLHDADGPETMDRFYHQLGSRNLPLSILIQHIASAMDNGSGSTRISLLASDVYLSLILSPRAPVLALFTPLAFLSLLQSVRRALKQRPTGLSNDPADRSVVPAHNRKKRGSSYKRGRKPRQSNGCEAGESEFVTRALFSVLRRLVLVMGLIHLDRFPECLKCLIQTVAEIPSMALDLWGDSSWYSELVGPLSRILGEVLKPEHGDPANSAAEVAKSLSPLIFSGKSQARSFALGFVTCTMMGLAKECHGVKKAFLNLPKFLAHRAPEKAEPRALAVESIMDIVRSSEYSDQISFVEYVVKMTQGKSKLRLLAVDLALTLMVSLSDWGESGAVENDYSWGVKCLHALIQRCSDSIGVVRARALLNLAQLVGHFAGNEQNCALLKEVMGIGDGRKEISMEGGIIELLRERCVDEKASVRKAALTLVTKVMALLGDSFDEDVLKTLGMACSDPLVSIRKAAISALAEAFRRFPNGSVATEWLHTVPRLITDNESNIQEECENLFLELVLDRISKAGSSGSVPKHPAPHDSGVKRKSYERQIDSLYPEGTLGLLREICHGEVTPWVKKICTNLGKKNHLRPKIALALQNIIKASESIWLSHFAPIGKWTAPEGAWFLLSEVSLFLPKSVEWEFLQHHWEILDKNGEGGEIKSTLAHGDLFEEQDGLESNSANWAGDRVFLLQTISNVALELPHEPAADLAHNLLKRIEGFNMHSTEVNAHVRALRTLCRRKASNSDEANELILRWVRAVLSKCCQILEKYVSEGSEADKEGTFSTPPRSQNRRGKRSTATSRLLCQAITAVYTIGSLIIVCPSADISTIIPLLHTIITSENTNLKLNKLRSSTVSVKQTAPSLYIQAWLTMGKICLADGKLAKRYIPLFVQELEKSDCAALRNNLVVTMADFCVRYTALVDCYITKITKCLCDPCELVRRQTFILLSRLLQRDYVKWRGVLFLRFLLSLVDESEKIRQLADFLFGNILKVKAPLLAYNSFVEAIFVLNDCHAHSGHSSVQGSRAENRLFSIRGNDEASRSKRMHIYVSLLKQMAPEHLLATFAKICAEILAAASDGMLDIEDATGQSVLQDAFQILVCKEIRIPTTRGATADSPDIDEEVGDPGGSSSSAAKGRAISQAVRKGLIQNTIPIFIELKRLLESKHSPLTGSLMDCLRLLLKDYKNEIDEILVADKQLQKELVYDMQKHDAAVRAREETAAKARAQAQATVRSVLKEVNRGASTPPLRSLSVPKVRSANGGGVVASGTGGRSNRPKEVLESLRRKQPFIQEDEN